MTFDAPSQAQLNWLLSNGVTVEAMINPEALRTTIGRRADDGRFEPDPAGDQWIVFREPEDLVFWQPRTDELATDRGRAFALGEAIIENAWTFALNGSLNVFASPLAWLRAGRDGIVIVDWSRTWSRLQDCPQIAVDRRLMNRFKRYCRPPYVPRILEMEGEANA